MVPSRWLISIMVSFMCGATLSQLFANAVLGPTCPPCSPCRLVDSVARLDRESSAPASLNSMTFENQRPKDMLLNSNSPPASVVQKRSPHNPSTSVLQTQSSEQRRRRSDDTVLKSGNPSAPAVTKQPAGLRRRATTEAPFKSFGDVGRKKGEAAFDWRPLPKTQPRYNFLSTVQDFLAKRPFMPDCCALAIKTVKRAMKNVRTLQGADIGAEWGHTHPQYIAFLLVAHAVADLIPDHGMLLEFGVASGDSITLTAGILKNRNDKRPVYGFDTFTGLPEDWRGMPKGAYAFNPDGLLPPVPKRVTLIKGLFSDTLPGFLKDHSDIAAFINIDCDLYKGAIFTLRRLVSRMRNGTIIHFHELNQATFADELVALYDFLTEHPNIKMEILNVVGHGEAALLRVVSV